MPMSSRFPIRSGRSAFTLIELMSVITLIALLSAFLVPAMQGIGGSRGLTRAVGDISALLEHARSQAMARSTHVFVGFQDSTGANLGGVAQLTVAEFVSKDGSDDTSPANLRMNLRPVRIDQVSLGTTPVGADPGVTVLGGISGDYTVAGAIGGQTTTFSHVIVFTPQGDAVIQRGVICPWLEVAIQPVKGGSVPAAEKIGIRVSGISGQQLVLRDGLK